MSEQNINRPMGPLQEGDQAIVDALQLLPIEDNIYQGSGEAVVIDYTPNRETVPGLPKDHWSIANLRTDEEGNPENGETTLLTVSSKDINVILRGGLPDMEVRTEEDLPKATDRKKLHDRETEQSIKLRTAERLKQAGAVILRIEGVKLKSQEVASASTSVLTTESDEPELESQHNKKFSDTHFIKSAPTLYEATNNSSGDSKIKVMRFVDDERVYEEHTEHEALVDLDKFLNNALEQTQNPDDPKQKELHDKADTILNSLRYLGEKEIGEGLSAIAESWKTYLREAPDRQVYVYTGIENVQKIGEAPLEEPFVKSDSYLLDKLLGTFSDEEIEEFKGKLVTESKDLHAHPDNARVIVFDDWTISGKQLETSVDKVQYMLGQSYRDKVEVQLLMATQKQVERIESANKVNVQAYFQANTEETVVAGIHSCGDYGFSIDIQEIAYYLLKQTPGYVHHPGNYSTLNPTLLTTIVSPYRFLKRKDLGNIERLAQTSNLNTSEGS